MARESHSFNGSFGRFHEVVSRLFSAKKETAKSRLAARSGLGLRVAVGWESRKGSDAPGHKGWSVASPTTPATPGGVLAKVLLKTHPHP